jgi:hypothetical protein
MPGLDPGIHLLCIITIVGGLEGAAENLGNECIELVALYTTLKLLGA